jgi:FAD/FMN-containing dehydrogenase
LKLLPAPEARIPLVAGFASVEAGAHAIEELYASGAIPAAIDYLDGATLKMAGGGFPGVLSDDIALLLITEAESEEDAALIAEALGGRSQRPDPADLWRWRDGVLGNVSGVLGAMTSEDFVVPLDRFGEAVSSVIEIGRNAGYEACSWGHAGDGNLHSTVVHHPDNPPSTEVAQNAGSSHDSGSLPPSPLITPSNRRSTPRACSIRARSSPEQGPVSRCHQSGRGAMRTLYLSHPPA